MKIMQFYTISNKISLSRQSNAANRSHNRMPVMNFSSVLFAHSCWMLVRAVIVDLFALKPCWLSGRRSFFSKQSVTYSHTIFSRTLETTIRQLTGLQLLLSSLQPFFRTGVMIAFFQPSGNIPSALDLFMILVKVVAISSAPNLS